MNKKNFIYSSPISKNETLVIESKVRTVIHELWSIYQTDGANALYQHVVRNCQPKQNDQKIEEEGKDSILRDEEMNAKINGDARRYQYEFFQRAILNNTIVSLGTGKGKTLIAIMTIRHFAATLGWNSGRDNVLVNDEQESTADTNIEMGIGIGLELGKQIWFLVPSVSLAVQQASTLRVNLPYTVSIACHTATFSEKARCEMAKAEILVATHGSALDLLRHYGDLFSLSRVNLLVIDECHNAVGKNNYAILMERFYHSLPEDQRPHVLGLTASPIINVPKNFTDVCLETLLRELEILLDSKLVSLSSLELDPQHSGIIESNVSEFVVDYKNDTINLNSPLYSDLISKDRRKELDQLKYLYEEFGPKLAGSYCEVLLREISPNNYNNETPQQFAAMKNHISIFKDLFVTASSSQMNHYDDGRTEKLKKLDSLLEKIYYSNKNNERHDDIVGIIFVERRISALALKHYLLQKQPVGCTMKQVIRCDLLTRSTQHVFKYVKLHHKLNAHEDKAAYDDWLHITQNSKAILDKLRKREINLLLCTSVVEEGVDVDACSFVILLDTLKTTKSYIQMKGRARQLHAKLYIFRNIVMKPPVTLDHAQMAERSVNDYIGKRIISPCVTGSNILLENQTISNYFVNEEEEALEKGEYKAPYAVLHFSSAKSLVFRYALSVPMDASARTSSEALRPYLPVFDDSRDMLHLPAHLPIEIRSIKLSEKYINHKKQTKEAMLAFKACVRLHKNEILSNRLLPLRRDDIREKLLESLALSDFPQFKPPTFHVSPQRLAENKKINVHIYPILQSGTIFNKYHEGLKGNGHLCIISTEPLMSQPSSSMKHKEMGTVEFQLGGESCIELTTSQFSTIGTFYSVIMNSRWSRRTGHVRFKYCTKVKSSVIPSFIIGCLNESLALDWLRMENVIHDYGRSLDERQQATTQSMDNMPRLWAPKYSPNSTYVSFDVKQDVNCLSPFPNTEFKSFQDYFLKSYSFKVEGACPLFRAVRLWDLPQAVSYHDPCLPDETKTNHSIEFDGEKEEEILYGLKLLLLARDACMEAPLADASLFLHCTLLPQILYTIERFETVYRFRDYCVQTFPVLGNSLQTIPLNAVIEACTAKSCGLHHLCTYDRLEFLGDAVLKLIHTDALIMCKDENLRRWLSCLHEGDLSMARSAMGCNERLMKACEDIGFTPFILLEQLGRGCWIPTSLETYSLVDTKDIVSVDDPEPSMKVKADFLEALLGLVYIHHGFQKANDVVVELGISFLQDKEFTTNRYHHMTTTISETLYRKAKEFLNVDSFKNKEYLIEATTHPSKVHSRVPCYQRLEWVGDAVLCLSIREFIFKHYPNMAVPDLVHVETGLVCNETLSFMGLSSGIHRLIDHLDSTLPSRFEKYELHVNSTKHGIWASHPPKVIADVVEALIGACHLDCGFIQGQKSALYVLHPIISDMVSDSDKHSHGIIIHPKSSLIQMVPSLQAKCYDNQMYCISREIWNGKSWVTNNISSDDDESKQHCISEVKFHGIPLIAVSDESSKIVARNRACALMASLLSENEELKEYLLEMSTHIESQMKKTKKSLCN